MDKGRSQILQKYFHITEYSLCAVLLISLAGGLVPLNLLEVLPLFLPDNHLALLGLVPYGTLLALSVLELQCELVEGTGNNLSGKILDSKAGPLTFPFGAGKLKDRPVNKSLLF